MRALRNIAFGLLGLITLALIAATFIENAAGTAEAMRLVYHSPIMTALWTLLASTALVYIFRRRTAMSLASVSIHVAFIVILAGAAVTHFCGRHGSVHLEENSPAVSVWTLDSGETCRFPFTLRLDDASTTYYPGTSSPMDYASILTIDCNGTTLGNQRVSMNKILSFRGYRFYQSSISETSSTLSVSYDPVGIAVSYCGYALLALSFIALLVERRRTFGSLIKRCALALLLVAASATYTEASAAAVPKTLPRPLAANFGKLHASWGGRTVPLQTVAREFCLKVYGKPSYRGLTAEQVLTGWLFYYDSWKNEPFIKIKGSEVKRVLATDESHVSILDFYHGGKYLLDSSPIADITNRNLANADEKVALVTQVITGKAIRIFPLKSESATVEWHSWVDDGIPPGEDSEFISASMSKLARDIAHRQFLDANTTLTEIARWQESTAGAANLPSPLAFRCELLYNALSHPWQLAGVTMAAGILCLLLLRFRALWRTVSLLIFACITLMLALRWIIGGHIPMTNGYETMLTMAWVSVFLGSLASFRSLLLAALCLLVASLALLVSAMGESNPAISPLMPVLASPLLSVHVLLVMTSYAFFAIIMLASAMALVKSNDRQRSCQLTDLSHLLLLPAVAALAMGIFIGAVWANQSWGRYWGWDPKETWALITLFVYALPLHASSFPAFRKPTVFNAYLVVAFLAVLMTYFGVNFFLAGLHSYANA